MNLQLLLIAMHEGLSFLHLFFHPARNHPRTRCDRLYIGPDESIQIVINNASAGDVLNLTAPVDYNGVLTLPSTLRIVFGDCQPKYWW